MKRNFLLPSESLNFVQHDCRLEHLKYRTRSSLYDLSVLSTLMNDTKSSLNLIYANYLSQPVNFHENNNEEKPSDSKPSKDNNTVISNTSASNEFENKE